MRKRFLPIPRDVDLEDAIKSVRATGRLNIDPMRLDKIKNTSGLEELNKVFDLVDLLRTIFYISRNYKVKKD